MNIQADYISFSGNCRIGSLLNGRHTKITPLQQPDTFTRTMPNCEVDLRSIKLGRFINEGRDAEVYATNNENYVLRIVGQRKYVPEEMIPVNDENGLIVATNKNDTIQLLKYMKGEPLYGRGWDILRCDMDKDEYMLTFNRIKNLPDKSFSDFIHRAVDIRKAGYDIDTINPNNILLDGEKLNIVDIEKRKKSPKIWIDDFDILINNQHMHRILEGSSKNEIKDFAEEIKNFYDRIISIAQKEGYEIHMPPIFKMELQDLKVYLYHKDFDKAEVWL